MMRWLQLRFVELVQLYELNVTVSMEFGTFNAVCDAGSRGKIAEMEAIMRNLHLTPEYVEPSDAVVELMDRALAEWRRLSDADRRAARRESAEVMEQRRQRRAKPSDHGPAVATESTRCAEPTPNSQMTEPSQARAATALEGRRGRSFLNTESSGPSPYVEPSGQRASRGRALPTYAELSASDGEFEEECAPAGSRGGPQRRARPRVAEVRSAQGAEAAPVVRVADAWMADSDPRL